MNTYGNIVDFLMIMIVITCYVVAICKIIALSGSKLNFEIFTGEKG